MMVSILLQQLNLLAQLQYIDTMLLHGYKVIAPVITQCYIKLTITAVSIGIIILSYSIIIFRHLQRLAQW